MRKEKKYHYIYKTTNNLSGKYYLGMHSTNNLEDGYLGSGRRLRYSLNKYGKENHTREILEFCKTRKELKSREEDIVNLNEIAKKDCMNLKVGGHGAGLPIGFNHSNESKEKNRQSHLGNSHNKETRRKMSISQKESWTDERKTDWGDYMKDFWTDERKKEHSDKLKGHIGHTKCKGVKKHKGFGALVSAGNIGKPKSKEHCENISKSRAGKKYPYSRKMTEELETKIKLDLLSNIKVKLIANKYNLSMGIIYKIKNNGE